VLAARKKHNLSDAQDAQDAQSADSEATTAIMTATELVEHAGRGISGRVNSVRVAVGSAAYAEELGVMNSEVRAAVEGIEDSAASALVVIYDARAVAVIAVRDQLRPESAQVITQLKNAPLCMQLAILSGDNLASAQAIATEAGIKELHARLLPHEKLAWIDSYKTQHELIAMVGDGINDAPALAAADIGIAANAAASDTALAVADVALMAADLKALPLFFKLARATMQTIHTNIVFALVVKAAAMCLVIAGLVGMWAAILADVGVLILVLLYSMRLLIKRFD
jgi:Cd2+/Zn2+-exporting ATPase